MNSEQEKELLDFLTATGFEGDEFVSEVKRSISLNAPRFSLKYKKDYGEEQMFFELHFTMDQQFGAYRLDGYKATHRAQVKVDHKEINGINTGILEQRMQRENWEDYFGKQTGYEHQIDRDFVQDTLAMLNKLPERQNFDGIKIQEELMFKYWPKKCYDHDWKQELAFLYEHSRDFSPSEFGICNTNLAYHIVSGKLDNLYDKLSNIRLEEYPGIELYPMLEKILSNDPKEFEIKYSRNQAEGFAEYTVPIKMVDGEFEPEAYQIVFTPYPEIQHGVYNGIDSRELEAMMQKIDWQRDDKLFVFHEDAEPEFLPKVGDVQEQMYRLSQDPVGTAIADQLQLKYWAEVTFFDGVIGQEAWDYLEALPKRKEEFPCDIEAFVAYNLVCGRAVQEQFVFEVPEEESQWVRLNPDKTDNNPFIHIGQFSNDDFELCLRLLPLPNLNYYQILNSLKRGGVPKAMLKNEREVLLEANPQQQTINVFTRDKQQIPANIHFNPDWQPGQTNPQQIEERQGKSLKPDRPKKARRKGL